MNENANPQSGGACYMPNWAQGPWPWALGPIHRNRQHPMNGNAKNPMNENATKPMNENAKIE